LLLLKNCDKVELNEPRVLTKLKSNTLAVQIIDDKFGVQWGFLIGKIWRDKNANK